MVGIDRRRFGASLSWASVIWATFTALGVARPARDAEAREIDRPGSEAMQPDTMMLAPDGWVPNNQRLPVLLYRRVIDVVDGDPAPFEALTSAHRWPAQWRNGIYSFHHYHSTAHEVLGFIQGTARVILGGPNGRSVELAAGDVAVLPCGTGHCLAEASPDLLVVGAYPADQHWDICRSPPSEAMIERMHRLPFPASDPVRGPGGPLTRVWGGA